MCVLCTAVQGLECNFIFNLSHCDCREGHYEVASLLVNSYAADIRAVFRLKPELPASLSEEERSGFDKLLSLG